MLNIFIILITIFDGSINLNKIAKENSLKKAAETAYAQGNYPEAITNLKTLVEEMAVTDDQAILNLGHAYFKNKDIENAAKSYEKALNSTNKHIKSIAAQQLGNISIQADNDKEKALAFYKEAMKANPDNKEAQRNYELLKKAKDQNKDNKDQQNKDDKKDQDKNKQDQEKGDNKNQKGDQKDNKDGKGDKEDNKKGGKEDDKEGKGDKKDGKGDKEDKDNKKDGKDNKGSDKEGDKKEKEEQAKGNKNGKDGEKGQNKEDKKDGKEDTQGKGQKEKEGGKKAKEKIVVNPEALAQMGMTEQRAKALLNAMRSNETQYIQQVKREPSKKNKKGKPDW